MNSPHKTSRAPNSNAVLVTIVVLLLAVACNSLPITSSPDTCDRSQAMRNALKQTTGWDCDLITDDDLADISRLSGAGPLQRSDFAGLDRMQLLSWGDLAELPLGVFGGLTNLQTLNLTGNDLTELSPGIFAGLTNLQSLDLEYNNLAELSSSAFDGLTNLQRLVLEHNNLAELPPDAFDSLTNLQTLDLWGNGDLFIITHPNANLDCQGCLVH